MNKRRSARQPPVRRSPRTTGRASDVAGPTGGMRRLSFKALTAIGTLATALVMAIVTAIGSNIGGWFVSAPPEPEPKPGSAFTAGIHIKPKCGQHYALAKALDPRTQAADLHALSVRDDGEMEAFLRAHRGSPQDTITVEVIFTGMSRTPTRILDVKIERLRVSPVLDGTALRTSCEGDPLARPVEVDLDTPPRELMSQGQPYFDQKDLEVSVEERENLRIVASAKANSYRWIFVVQYIDGSGNVAQGYLGADGQLHAQPDDVPQDAEFSLTGTATSYQVTYTESGGRFYLDGD
ncbi:hypothetical protein AB0B48_03120 [Micromonospora sp. NPDC049089]|uniref:hypothetical protein n=1 Tax=Micromonospora sp. NPDC049089 TaxID=3155496 RepID=UPI00340B22C4